MLKKMPFDTDPIYFLFNSHKENQQMKHSIRFAGGMAVCFLACLATFVANTAIAQAPKGKDTVTLNCDFSEGTTEASLNGITHPPGKWLARSAIYQICAGCVSDNLKWQVEPFMYLGIEKTEGGVNGPGSTHEVRIEINRANGSAVATVIDLSPKHKGSMRLTQSGQCKKVDKPLL